MTSSTLAATTTEENQNRLGVAGVTIKSTAKETEEPDCMVSGVMTRSLAVMAETVFGETIASNT